MAAALGAWQAQPDGAAARSQTRNHKHLMASVCTAARLHTDAQRRRSDFRRVLRHMQRSKACLRDGHAARTCIFHMRPGAVGHRAHTQVRGSRHFRPPPPFPLFPRQTPLQQSAVVWHVSFFARHFGGSLHARAWPLSSRCMRLVRTA